MKDPKRLVTAGLLGAGLILGLAAFQIPEYPFGKTRFGKLEGTRKVYKSLTVPEIKKVMRPMANSIGVDCDYCHNEQNYASDEKPAKDFARHKIQMIEWLNVKYRPSGAKWEYSCYSCHRGRVRPVPSAPPAARGPGG